MKATRLNQLILQASRELAYVENFLGAVPAVYDSDGVTALETHGGGVVLTTAATDNDMKYLEHDTRFITPTVDKPFSFRGRLKFSETAAANASNFFVGLSNTKNGAVLQDDGAGLISAFDGVGFFKKDGDQYLWVAIGDSSTTETKRLDEGAQFTRPAGKLASSAQAIDFGIDFYPFTSAKANVTFWWGNSEREIWKFTDFDYSGMGALAPQHVLKAGAATAETMEVYYNAVSAVR